MEIFCIASCAPGHIDFGGMGFVQLAKQLEEQGHSVRWLTYGDQVDRLRSRGCQVGDSPCVSGLTLRPFFSADETHQNYAIHQSRIHAIHQFHLILKQYSPDLILFDRLLAYGGLVAEQLSIPYVAVGTPGGYWRYVEDKVHGTVDIHPVENPVPGYREYTQSLKKELKWSAGEVDSAWLRSPYINITFMPKAFFADISEQANASVFNHKDVTLNQERSRIGMSFGNQGNHGDLVEILGCLANNNLGSKPVDIFMGTRDELHAKLKNTYPAEHLFWHKWVDFGSYLSTLRGFIFLGGVGSIWHCIDNLVPMAIVAGHIGDQLENAKRVQALNIGGIINNGMDEHSVVKKIEQLCHVDYQVRIKKLCAKENYTDTLQSISERIISLS